MGMVMGWDGMFCLRICRRYMKIWEKWCWQGQWKGQFMVLKDSLQAVWNSILPCVLFVLSPPFLILFAFLFSRYPHLLFHPTSHQHWNIGWSNAPVRLAKLSAQLRHIFWPSVCVEYSEKRTLKFFFSLHTLILEGKSCSTKWECRNKEQEYAKH